jgi:hypothetical protein
MAVAIAGKGALAIGWVAFAGFGLASLAIERLRPLLDEFRFDALKG